MVSGWARRISAPRHHFQAGLGAGIEKAGDEKADDGQGEEPAGESSPESLLGDSGQRLNIDILSDVLQDARHVTRADDRHDPGARRVADGVREVKVPLVDQGSFQPGEFFADGL
jgi:hypothetical protein